MAGLGRKVWSAGDTLTAADVNGYLMDQTVMVFAGTAARASAIPTPSAGMVAYSTATGLQLYNGSSWGAVGGKVLQVVSTTKTDTFTTSSTTFADVTGLSVSITPSSTANKILVIGSITGCHDVGVSEGGVRMVRDSTAIMVGDTAGSRTSGFQIQTGSGNLIDTIAGQVLDSPATTSTLTYKWQAMNAGAGTFYVNRSKTDTNAAYTFRAASSITVMEISA